MIWELYVGNKPTGITVRPDGQHKAMWRVHDDKGNSSDMVNFVRAKDASVSWAQDAGHTINASHQVTWRAPQAP